MATRKPPASKKKPAARKPAPKAAPKPARKPKAPARKSAPAPAPAAPAKMGRPTLFTEQLAMGICERLADGESLRKICTDEGMPHRLTVLRWVEERSDFRSQYVRAREAQADLLAEEVVEIADDSGADYVTEEKDGKVIQRFDGENVARARLRADSRKWFASKVAPKKYGDKLAVGGAEDLPPIQQAVTLTATQRAARIAALLDKAAKAKKEKPGG